MGTNRKGYQVEMEANVMEPKDNIELQTFDAKDIEEAKVENTDLLRGKEDLPSNEKEKKNGLALSGNCCDQPYKRCLWIVTPILLSIIFLIVFLYFYVVHPLLNGENPTIIPGDVTISGLTLGGIFGGTRVVTLKADVDMTNTNSFDLYMLSSNIEVRYPTLDGPVIGNIKMPQTILRAKETKTVETQTRLVDFPPPGDETVELLFNSGVLGEPLTLYTIGESTAYAQIKLFNLYARTESEVACEMKTYLTEPSKDSQFCTYEDTSDAKIRKSLPEEFQ